MRKFMKKTLLIFACVITSTTLFAQTADDIINKYADAIGGRDKLKAIKTIYMEGTVDANGQQIVIKDWKILKKADRSEFTVVGMTGYTIITTDSGWSFSPFQGQKVAEPMTADMVKRAQVDLNSVDPLVDYKEKGYKVAYKGKDDVDGSDAYKLELTISDSNVQTYFLDPTTYYIMRVKSKEIVNGKTQEAQQDFSNYQKTPEGYVFAMSAGGDGGSVKFTAVKVNTDMDPSLFVPKR
jgi:hypothetical protein